MPSTISGGGSFTASSTDTLTNKSIDANSNTLTNLSVTSVKDGTDSTKVLAFDVSAISTATTRTLTYPNSNTSLPIIGQTLTLSGPTAARTVTLPDANFTVARTDAANTFTGTQTVGALVATTVNGNTITTGSSTYTGTAAQTYTFPTTSATIARTDAANSFTGDQTFGSNITVTGGTITSGTSLTLTTASGATDATLNLGTSGDRFFKVTNSVTGGTCQIISKSTNSTGISAITTQNNTVAAILAMQSLGHSTVGTTAGIASADLNMLRADAGTLLVGTFVNTPLVFAANSVETMRLPAAGGVTFPATNTAGGTTGAQTINKTSGTVNFAATATSLVVTNSLVTTSSIVFAVVRTNDSTATIKNVVPGTGSFTITITAAATAETSVGFYVIN